MPTNLVKTAHQEEVWNRAKTKAEQEGHKDNWPYVVKIYESMIHSSKSHSVDTSRFHNLARVDPKVVHDYLSDNYPERVLKWVDNENWRYLESVPLEFIKMDRRPGGRNMAKVRGIAKAVTDGEHMDPIVLVQMKDGFKIADGYHRTLGFKHAGKKAIHAFVATGDHDKGPWDSDMHDAKLNVAMAVPNFNAMTVQSLEGRYVPKTDLDHAYVRQYKLEYPSDFPDESPTWTIRASGEKGEIHRAQDGWGEIYFLVKPNEKPKFIATRAADVMLYHLSKPFKDFLIKKDVKKLGFGDKEWDKHLKEYVEQTKEVSKMNESMSVEQRLERAERMLAVLVAKEMAATPNSDHHEPKGYPHNRSQYGDPEDKAYPLDTKQHARDAAVRFSEYHERYSKAKQDELKRRIDEAEKKFKIGKYRESESAMSAADYSLAIEEVLNIVKDAVDHEPTKDEETKELTKIIGELLKSEENLRTRREMFDADAMIDDFMRDIKGYAGFGHS